MLLRSAGHTSRGFPMIRTNRLLAVLPLVLGFAVACPDAAGQNVTSEGWAKQSAGLNFYVELPMIDSAKEPSGIGGNIVAETMINTVRYADKHPLIRHVVFKMNTGGGMLHHADAMADIIEEHHDNTEYHIIIKDAISAGIWTAFSCDSIFIIKGGTIGGATAYQQRGDGTVKESSDIPLIAARMAYTAERNGHNPKLIAPMMDLKVELFSWTDYNGKTVLAQEKPKDSESLTNFQHLDKADTVLTLTAKEAVEIGLARDIADFDATLVGKEIGVPGWTKANRYGKVMDEIGALYNLTRAMEDYFVAERLALPKIPVTSQNRNSPMVENMLKERSKVGSKLTAIRKINEALNALPDVHVERQVYLVGPDNATLVADAQAWQSDADQTRKYAAMLTLGMRELESAYKKNEIDTGNLEEIQAAVNVISERISGILKNGNAAYWANKNDN